MTYEIKEQIAVISWCDSAGVLRWGDLFPGKKFPIFAIRNEGKMSGRTGKNANRAGRRSGIPDLFLSLPVGNYPGLYIEMKRTKVRGRKTPGPTPNQEHWLGVFGEIGWGCLVRLDIKLPFVLGPWRPLVQYGNTWRE
jgi:hypothetical protein